MVTSSAVVGSSAISSFGLQAIAMAIMTRWFMPPESWCGKAASRRSGAGMPTCSSSSIARVARACWRSMSWCRRKRLDDLEADGEAGIEAGRRLLEDHRHVLAGEAAPGGFAGEVSRSLPSKASRSARDLAGKRHQPHQRQHGDALAGAGFADDAEHLALLERERHAVHRAQWAGRSRETRRRDCRSRARPCRSPLELGVEGVAQAVAEQVEGQHSDRGSSTPGKVTTHQARKMNSRASASMVPHSGVGGCAPRPRKPRAAASRMAVEMPSVACTISGAAQFGSTSLNISRKLPAPATLRGGDVILRRLGDDGGARDAHVMRQQDDGDREHAR